MSLSFDGWLILGIAGFYLYDSAMMLRIDQIVVGKSNRKWFAICPLSQWMLRGRIPYLPNPLTPGEPLFRVTIPVKILPLDSAAVEETDRMLTSLRLLSYLAPALLAILVVGLPLVILRLGGGRWLLSLIALTYATIILMLTLLYMKREQIGLSRRAFFALAFDAIACPPFAINLVRKVTLLQGIHFDPITMAFAALPVDGFGEFTQAIHARLQMEMECEDEDSPRTTAIKALQEQLTTMAT